MVCLMIGVGIVAEVREAVVKRGEAIAGEMYPAAYLVPISWEYKLLVAIEAPVTGAAGIGRLEVRNGETIALVAKGAYRVPITWETKLLFAKEVPVISGAAAAIDVAVAIGAAVTIGAAPAYEATVKGAASEGPGIYPEA